VLYQDTAAVPEEIEKAIWLELRSDEPVELRRKIVSFCVQEIAMPGAEHIYFHAPGGQVFRLVGEGEDLSRFES